MRFKLLETFEGFKREYCEDGFGYIVEYQNGDYDVLSEEWVKKNIKNCANAILYDGEIISSVSKGFSLCDYYLNRKIRLAIKFYRLLSVYGFVLEYKNSTLYVDGKPIRKQGNSFFSKSSNRLLASDYFNLNMVLNALVYTLYTKPRFHKDYRILTFARGMQVGFILKDVSASLDLSGSIIDKLNEYDTNLSEVINPYTNEKVLCAIDKSCEKIK